jgi:hypothetical protein
MANFLTQMKRHRAQLVFHLIGQDNRVVHVLLPSFQFLLRKLRMAIVT